MSKTILVKVDTVSVNKQAGTHSFSCSNSLTDNSGVTISVSVTAPGTTPMYPPGAEGNFVLP